METDLIKRIEQIIYAPQAEATEMMKELQKFIWETENRLGMTRDSKSISTLFDETVELIERTPEDGFITTGFENFDKEYGGFYPGELVVLGARPSMGKTQLLISMSLHMSSHIPVLFYTFDLTESLLMNRYISAITGLSGKDILQRNLNSNEMQRLKSAGAQFQRFQLHINDGAAMNISSLKQNILKQIGDHGIKVIMLDYLQLMNSGKYRYNRESDISMITRELKSFAQEYNVCIILSSQLNRSVETRGGCKRPTLSDLRESGAIEQDADKVIFIYRPEYYKIVEDEHGNDTEGLMELIVAKNRNGKTGEFWLERNDDFTAFQPLYLNRDTFNFTEERLNELNMPF